MVRPLADSIHLPGAEPSKNIEKRFLIYFITGNPGLIEYYDAFLSHLHMLLTSGSQDDTKKAQTAFEIYGASIPGFDFADFKAATERWKELGLKHAPPFSLDEIIDALDADLWRIAELTKRDGEALEIIVMGHSLGSFITLELVQRHRRRLEKKQHQACMITGGVCLFATVMDIAKSERGLILSVSRNTNWTP